MYRISVLAEDRQRGLIYADRIRRFCMENGIFPEVKVYENQERFFEQIQMLEPTSVLLAAAWSKRTECSRIIFVHYIHGVG